jgi:ABC-2 type transport system ATP-binding protein
VAFLDEPTAGVDPEGRLAIRQVVADLRAGGTAVLLATHELEEAERLADRVIVVDHGRVVGAGTPAELRASAGLRQIRFRAPAGLDLAGLGATLGAPAAEPRAGEYVVEAEGQPATIAALTAWLAARDLPLTDLQAGVERLEEVYLRLTAGGPQEQP